MARNKKVNIGDIFSFNITDEIIDILEIQPKDIFDKIKKTFYKISEKKGYGVVINRNKSFILIQIKRVNINDPTLEEILNAKTISVQWTWQKVLFEKEYAILGNMPIEPIEMKYFYEVCGTDYDDYMTGKEVEFTIVEVKGDLSPTETIKTTRDKEIIKELFPFGGYGTHATIMMDYLLNYYRDENDISTLRV